MEVLAMKKSLLGATLGLVCGGAGLVPSQVCAGPAYQDQVNEAYSTPPAGPVGSGFPSAPLGGNLIFDLANTGLGALAPVLGPVLGKQGVQGELLPLVLVGENVLGQLPQISLMDSLVGDSLQPVLGIVMPAVSPLAVGLLTRDQAMLVIGGINFVDVLLTQLVPAVVGNLPVVGTLGGGLPIVGSRDGLPVVGGLLGGGLPIIGSLGNVGGLLGGLPVLGSLGGLPLAGVLGSGGVLNGGLLGTGTGLVNGLVSGLI
jgi:hypothetical protein